MSDTIRKGPLHGVSILDLTTTEAGRFCGTLLADMGAAVAWLGDRRQCGEQGDVFIAEVLMRNRRFVDMQAFGEELARTQVLLVDEGSTIPGNLDHAACLKLRPALVYCHLSPFGAVGPWADRFGTDLTVQALSGFMELTGEPGRPPIRMGARVLPLMAGAMAAIQVIGCLLTNPPSGGAEIDVSVLDVALNTLTYMAPMYLTLGQVPGRVGSGHTTIYPYNAFEVADGYIVAAPFTGRFWRNFCQALGAPEWGTDPRFKDFQNRLDNRPILEPMLNQRMKEKSREQWLKILADADVPCGPVNSVSEAIEMTQSKVRELVAEIETSNGAKARILGFPLKITEADGSLYRPDYRSSRVAAADAPSAAAANTSVKPLAGLRVLDLTRMAAGPYCTQMLVDLGAEVIKVEEPRIGDPTRRNVPMIGSLSSYFYSFNRGKKSVTLDMKTPEGNQFVRKLMTEVDVVVENFRPGVMDRLRLDYATVSKRNPGVVYASISGFGQTGPLREKISFDLVNQAVAGLLSITSEPGRAPARLGMAVGDLGGGLFACVGIMAALKQRKRTGKGAHIDVSLHDVLVTLLGGVAQEYLSSGVDPGPLGSEHSHHVPERVFATSDGWVTLEAWTDRGWQELVSLPAFTELRVERFATLSARLAHRDEIHRRIEAVIATRPTAHWLRELQRPGIGIAAVVTVAKALDSEHVAARNLVVSNTLPDGERGRTIGSAFRMNGQPLATREGPPALGANNDELLPTAAAV